MDIDDSVPQQSSAMDIVNDTSCTNNSVDIEMPITAFLDDIIKICQTSFNNKKPLKTHEIQKIQSDIHEVKNQIINYVLPLRTTSNVEPDHLKVQTNKSISKNDGDRSTSNATEVQRNKTRETYARVVIKSIDSAKLPSASNVESSVSKMLEEYDIDATILNSYPTKSGDLGINFKSNDNVHLIADTITNDLGYEAFGSQPMQPKVKISHIPKHIPEENIKDKIIESNAWLESFGDEELTIMFSYIRHDYRSVVCKISPNLRLKIIENKNHLILGRKRCPVKDHFHVRRCTKCSKFDHVKSKCKATSETCSFCSSSHPTNSCPFKENKKKHKCINCADTEFDVHHPSHSENCPSYLHQRLMIIKRTNWGDGGPPNALDSLQ